MSLSALYTIIEISCNLARTDKTMERVSAKKFIQENSDNTWKSHRYWRWKQQAEIFSINQLFYLDLYTINNVTFI